MYFVRSGYINLSSGALKAAGYYSVFWSSAAYPTDVRLTFSLDFASTNAYLSNNTSRYDGFSLQPHFSLKTSCYSIKESHLHVPKET